MQSIGGFVNAGYNYDANGNVNYDGRNNVNITYNFLNLPQSISQNGNTISTYIYDATGRKLRKVVTELSTDYVAGIQYTNGNMDFVQTEEGRATKNGGNWDYEYTLTDHLGNSRVNIDSYAGTARVLQEDEYYPFGLDRQRYSFGVKNKYLYNKKEVQEELGQYDYGARFYDPVVARWGTIDRLAEDPTQISLTPYNYVANDPINKDDPDGNCPNCVTAAIGAGIGAIVGAAVEGGSQLYHSGEITSWRAVGGSALQGAVTGGVAGFTGGASLLVAAGTSAGANVIGGVANRVIQGQTTTVKDVAVDAAIGVAAGAGGKLLSKGVSALGENTLSKVEQKSISSLEKNIAEHQQKLNEYIKDPMKFDNKNVLKNAPSNEVKDKIIAGRVKHLEKEINTFKENIQKIKDKN